jgi:hypothetical protein
MEGERTHMLIQFLEPHSLPFAIALAVVAGLFILEIISSLLGATVLGLGGEGPDLDIDADADFDLTMDIDIEAPDISANTSTAPSGILSWLGARDVPFLIWLVSFLTMFGLAGLIIQSGVSSILDRPLPALIASLIVCVPALGVTRVIANWVALLMPKTETSAMRTRYLGGHRGTITQGTAKRGKPAEAKIKDRHGNIHYLRVEPLDDDEAFAQGTDVTIIRKRGDRFFVI